MVYNNPKEKKSDVEVSTQIHGILDSGTNSLKNLGREVGPYRGMTGKFASRLQLGQGFPHPTWTNPFFMGFGMPFYDPSRHGSKKKLILNLCQI